MKKNLLTLLIILVLSNLSFSQTGPGGVGNTSTNILWLRSNDISLNDGDNITSWADYSTHSNTVTQSDDNLNPVFKTSIVNGYPVVRFNKDNGRIRKTNFNDFPSTEITAIYVNKNDGESSDGILSYASSGSHNDFLLYNSNNLAPHIVNENHNSSIDLNDNTWHISNTSWKSNGGNLESWKDGSKDYTGTFNDGASFTNDGCLAIAGEQDAIDGDYDAAQAHFGDFTEIIVYNTYLNNAQQIIVSNYLAAKYNISLAANDFYTQDDNGSGNFDYNVAGIGQASDGSNHTEAKGSGIITIESPSNLSDDDYLIWGENTKNSKYIFNDTGEETMRLNTTWRVSKRNDLGTVTVSVAKEHIAGLSSCNTLQLIVSSTSNFATKTAYDMTLSGGEYVASNVNFSDSDYFTFEYSNKVGYTGPGGVGDCITNILWLRAEDLALSDGDAISSWTDFSGNGNNVSQSNSDYQPIFKENITNSYPIVRFNKDLNRLIKTSFEQFPASEITTIYTNINDGESSDGIFSYASSAHDNDYLLYGSNSLLPHRRNYYNSNILFNDNAWHIAHHSWKSDNGASEVWKDGAKAESRTGFQQNTKITNNGCLAIAAEQDGVNTNYASNQTHNGDFSEIIMYNTYLNKARQIIVSNYLSAKYNTPLTDNDFYTQDDNGDFDFNVAGIGQADDGSNHTDSRGTGIVRMNTASNLSDNDYLFWGEDTKNSNYIFNDTGEETMRLNTTWRVSKQNDLGTVTLSIAKEYISGLSSCNTLQLIVSNASDFSTKTVYDMTLSGEEYVATNVNFSDSDYFTFEFSNKVGYTGPGGVGDCITNILWLRAEDFTLSDGDAISSWIDYSGNSNNVSQPNSNYQPIFKENVTNSYPVIRFNKESNKLIKIDFEQFPASEITTIYTNINDGESDDGIFSYASSAHDNDYLLYNSSNLTPHRKNHYNSGISFNDNAWHIAHHSWKSDNGSSEIWKDGTKAESRTGFKQNTKITNNGCLAIAAEQDGVNTNYNSSQTHNGDFSEIIMYNTYLNKARQIIVSNYLSAKYNTPLTDNDFYTQDDNGDFDFNVAGIGQADDGSNHTDSRGTGIIRMNTPSDLSNDDYLFWGEETKDATYDFASIDADTYRLNSKWRVSKVNDLGTVTILFNENDVNLDAGVLKCASLKFVTSNTSDFATKTAYDLNLNAGVYTVNNVNFTDADYFTIEYSVNKTIWDGANWSSAPTVLLKTVFTQDYDMNSNPSVTACKCQVDADKTITIPDGKYLEVQYDIENDGTIIVENEGALVQHDNNSTIGGAGIFQMNKTSLPLNHYYDYIYWSSPINSATYSLGDITNAWRYYEFDPNEANNGHTFPGWVQLAATDIPEKAVGYAISAPTGAAANTVITAHFVKNSDPFNNGNISINILKKGGPDNIGDFNLLGNPYPSAIDFHAFINDADNNKVEGAYSLWTNCADLDANGHHQDSGYSTYSAGSGTATSACDNGTAEATRYIASGQGFMIEVNTDNSTVTFKNDYRVTDNNDNFLNRNTQRDIVWVDMTDSDGKFNQIAVGFYSGATDAYDRNFDATSMNTGNGYALYSIVNSKKLAIQGLRELNGTDKTVPLGVESDIARTITMHINHIEGLTSEYIYIRDLYLNTIHDLKATDYTTTVTAGDFTDRFELIFSQHTMSMDDIMIDPNAVLLTQKTGVFSLTSNNDMNITGVTVYDITGKMLYNNQEIDTASHQLNLQRIATGNMLIFRVQMNNENIVVKKAIKQ